MFKKIIVPVDLSDRNEKAMGVAVELAEASGGDLTAIHVVELIPGISREEDPSFYGRLESNAEEFLNELTKDCSSPRVAIAGEVLFGAPPFAVIERAKEVDADLIVLASHRIAVDQPHLGWGTVSYKIGILAQCPVMLIK